MASLDSQKTIETLDASGTRFSIANLGQQVEQAWAESVAVKLPANYKKCSQIIIHGMGGSGLAGHVAQSVFADQLPVPVRVINDYSLPASLGKNTLYIALSYSGNTEEVTKGLKIAQKQGAKVVVVTTGGTLAAAVHKKQVPGYVIDPVHNPSGQPRLATGYMTFGLLGMLHQLGYITISSAVIKRLPAIGQKVAEVYGPEVPTQQNWAKQLAVSLEKSIPCLMVADFAAGAAHVCANILNESAKQFATYFVIPELNHHLLEGLAHPPQGTKALHFLSIQSQWYHQRNQQRLAITERVLKKQGIALTPITLRTQSKLEQSVELVAIGSYVAFYLAMLHRVDPGPNQWVDYLKAQLKK